MVKDLGYGLIIGIDKFASTHISQCVFGPLARVSDRLLAQNFVLVLVDGPLGRWAAGTDWDGCRADPIG